MNFLRSFKNLSKIVHKNFINYASSTHINTTQNKEIETVSNDDFVPVYKFPYIRQLGLINRLKIYQAAAAGIALPVTLGLFATNIIDFEMLYVTNALGITGTSTLFIVGTLTDKFVGFVYVHKENKNLIRFSYLDFWGIRKNVEVPLEDLVPLSEIAESFMDNIFIKLPRYSTKDVLKINLKFGKVLDETNFNRIFSPF